jgi:hypothetical protein
MAKHTTKTGKSFLLEWPADWPNLSPTENLWDVVNGTIYELWPKIEENHNFVVKLRRRLWR